MPSLKPRYEKFCQYYINYPNATDAARYAGYAPRNCRQQGSRLLADERIVARISALRAGVARSHCMNTEQLMGKLENVFQRAMSDHNWNAANRAIAMQAQLGGLLPETRRNQHAGDAAEPAQPSVNGDILPFQTS